MLGKILGAFEAIQGRPATLEDIERIAGHIVRRAVDSQAALDGQEGTLDATAPSDGRDEVSAPHDADGESGSRETQLAQVGGTSPRNPTPKPIMEEKERQVVETQRQKISEQRKAELGRLAGIKIAPKPTEKQLMPEDWAQRLPTGVLAAVDASAKRYNVPRELLARVLWQESEFKEDSNRDKPVGRAKGIAGLEDGTKGIKAELQRLAGLRGDRVRVGELQSYDVMNASQSLTRNELIHIKLLPAVCRAGGDERGRAMRSRLRWLPRSPWRAGDFDRARQRCARRPIAWARAGSL